MADQGSSFIPKSGVSTVRRTKTVKRIYIFAYISYIIFFTTLFAVVGIYLYGASVNRSLASLQGQMATEQKRFSVSDIESIHKVDQRLKKSLELLNESSAPSRIFSDIEKIVASNIYFSSFTYKILPNRKFTLELVGRADDFNQVAVQRDFLSGSDLLSDAEVTAYDYAVSESSNSNSDLLLAGNAKLSFTFTDTRDLSLIAYQVPGGFTTAVPNNIEIDNSVEENSVLEVDGLNDSDTNNTSEEVATPATDTTNDVEAVSSSSTAEVSGSNSQ